MDGTDMPNVVRFFNAIANGDLETVEKLLATDPNLALCTDAEGNPALHCAVTSGHIGIVESILTAGADVDVRDGLGRTPLHQACAQDLPEIVRLLLRSGADVDALDDDRYSPLMEAAMWGGIEVARLLLDKCATLVHEDSQQTALGAAAWAGNLDLVRLLLDKGALAMEPAVQSTPLHAAAVSPRPDPGVLEALVDAGIPVDATGPDLYRLGPAGGVTPLHLAVEATGPIQVEFLLSRGARVDARDGWGWTPLRRLVERRYRVPEARADPLCEDESAVLELLLEHGADVTVPDQRGVTVIEAVLSPTGNPAFARYFRDFSESC